MQKDVANAAVPTLMVACCCPKCCMPSGLEFTKLEAPLYVTVLPILQ